MKSPKLRFQAGFSLVELLVVVLLLSVLMAAVFKQVTQVQARVHTEQSRADVFQESREFVDQLARDLRGAGYPNVRNWAAGVLGSPAINDTKNAVGLVKVDADELRFEGDLDGNGSVDSVIYSRTTSGNGCPCLQRSEQVKIAGNPLTGQGTPAFAGTSLQGVQNGTSSNPIFRAFRADGTEVTLPVDINSNASTIAQIETIAVSIDVQATNRDLEAGQRPESTVRTVVRLSNCSGAASGQSMSCQ